MINQEQSITKAVLSEHNGVKYLIFKPFGLHAINLPVITKGSRDKQEYDVWTWNGDLDKPTLRPSVRCKYHNGTQETEIHYWLTDGIAHCLSDCKDGNANKKLELVDVSDFSI